ncbi:hypothetical protein Gotur_035337, partial [Gossypium turneri]
VICRIKLTTQEYLAVKNECLVERVSKLEGSVVEVWGKPPVGWVKKNCDGALDVKHGVAGVGVICRDCNGVELAVNNRLKEVILETDSLIVFSETKKKDFERRWKLKPILKRFDILKDQLHKFLIQRIRRDANKAADWVTKHAKVEMCLEGWINHQPSSLVFILNNDGLPTPPGVHFMSAHLSLLGFSFSVVSVMFFSADTIEMGWLRDIFLEPDDDSTELERIRYVCAYILEIVRAGEFSWGSAVLATLYRKMCGATRQNKAKIGGYLSLLQSRARFRFSFLHPRFQWTPYEDRAVILDEFFQNLNIWHVKVPLVNYAIVEMHQLDRVLQFWSHYIQMWKDRYDYIPTREPIIVPELACVPKYMPWFRIHGKPYLLSEEERQRQLRFQMERRGPLNPRRRDDDAGPSTVPTQSPRPSPGPATAPTQSSGPIQPMTPTAQPFQMVSGAYHNPFMYPNPYMFSFSSPMVGWNAWPGSSLFFITLSGPPIYRPPSHEGSHEGLSGSSSFYQSQSPYGFQTPSALVIQTLPQSVFYQSGSSSQHRQSDPLPEEPESPPEAGQMRNPARNRRRHQCGTESGGHIH